MKTSPRFLTFSFSYFCYFAIVGLVVPFTAVFLDGRGFNSIEIGEILAIVIATKIIGPTLWAMAADKSGQQLSIIRLGAGLAFLTFTLMFWVEGYWPIVAVLALFSLFWTAILPQMEVMTLLSVRQNAKIYARIRLWGSVGFIILAIAAGEILGSLGSESFIFLCWLVLLLLFLSALWLKQPRTTQVQITRVGSIFAKICSRSFFVFFIAGLLLQVSFGTFYSFFALYLRDLSYPSYAAGVYLSIGVLAEIGIFIIAGRLFKRFEVKTLIAFSIFITAIRWYLTGHLADNLWLLALIQVIHAASFGLYHTASIQFIQQHFHANQHNRGQAIYIAGVYGIGGALGAYVAGILWLDGSGAQQSFEIAALIALIATGFALMVKAKTQNK